MRLNTLRFDYGPKKLLSEVVFTSQIKPVLICLALLYP